MSTTITPIGDATAIQAERMLLGSLLNERDAMPTIADRITERAFVSSFHRAIFLAIQRCWNHGTPADVASVHDELARDPDFQDTDRWLHALYDMTELMRYSVEYGWPCHAPYYASQVIDHARRRALAEAGAEIIRAASAGTDLDPALAMHQAMAGLDAFGAIEEPKGPRTYAEIVPAFQEELVDRLNGALPRRNVPSGFTLLDHRLQGGFYPGELIILAARPGMGKSAMMIQLAHNAAKLGKHTLIYSAEMSAASLVHRAVSDVAGAPFGDLATQQLTPSQFELFQRASEQLARLPVSIDDTSAISTAQMLVRTQAEQRKHDLGLVIFDYISLAGDKVQGDNEQQRTTKIVRNLKHIARVCDVPVIALGQLNRAVETRSGRRPTLSDLRDSGSVEQEADKVLFLYRHDYYVGLGVEQPDDALTGTCDVIIAKHRNGPTGDVRLRFLADTMAFRDLEPSYLQRQVA